MSEPAAKPEPGPDRAERPGAVRGVWLVAATLSLFIFVPAITIGLWTLLKDDRIEAPPLIWSERENWFLQEARPRPLEYDKFVQGETGRKYKKTNLVLEPGDEQMLQRLAAQAQREDFFDSEDIRRQLSAATDDYPGQWYPPYLLASWYRVNGDDAAYDRWITEAFKRTSAAIVQRLVDEEGGPVAGFRIPAVAIGFDRVIDGERNATLALIYPAPFSDKDGVVYLPTWPTIYRLTDPEAPPGVEPSLHPRGLTLLPQAMDGSVPNWFSVPPPGIAKLPDAVVEAGD